MGNVLRFMAARALPAAVSFVAIAIYTRLLSREEYGEYSIALAGANLVVAVLFHWLGQSVVRFGIPSERERSAYLAAILVLYGACTTAAVVAVVAGTLIFRDWVSATVLVAALFVVFESWSALNQRLAIALSRPGLLALTSVLKSVCGLCGGAIAASLGYGAPGVLAGAVLGIWVASLVPAQWRAWRDSAISRVKRLHLIDVTRYGAPLGVTLALGYALIALDRILLAIFHGVDVAGPYAAGFDLATAAVMLAMTSVNIAMYPLVLDVAAREGPLAVRRKMKENLDLMLITALPVLVVFVLLADNVGAVVLGAEFSPTAASIMPWLAIGAFVSGMRSYHADVAFHLARDTRTILGVAGVVLTVNAAMNLALLPRFGLPAAAAAMVCANVVGLLVSLWKGRLRNPACPGPDRESWKIAAAAAAAAVAVWPMAGLRGPGALVAQLTLLCTTYAFVLILLRVGPVIGLVRGSMRRGRALRRRLASANE